MGIWNWLDSKILLGIWSTEAYQCYKCAGATESVCNDPFNKANMGDQYKVTAKPYERCYVCIFTHLYIETNDNFLYRKAKSLVRSSLVRWLMPLNADRVRTNVWQRMCLFSEKVQHAVVTRTYAMVHQASNSNFLFLLLSLVHLPYSFIA